ncbi:sigma 54-interacting transcriptional regulator [Syntrophomonas erecta]
MKNDLRMTDICVAEAMTQDFGQVEEHTPLKDVLTHMLDNHWDEVVVTNHSHHPLGLITKEHLLRELSAGTPRTTPAINICPKEIFTTVTTEELTQARDLMRLKGIGRLPVLDKDGHIVGILTAKDVCNGFSSRLEMLGEHMYAVMENIAEAIQVVNCDGLVTFWNQGAEKIFKVDARQILGKPLQEFFPEDLLLNVIQTGKSHRHIFCELSPGVHAIRNAVPVKLPGGLMVGAVCTTMNVSRSITLMEKLDEATTMVKHLERSIGYREEQTNGLFYTVNLKTQRILAQARRVGQTDATVLIQGESGTGKEVLAYEIYQNSLRSRRPFVEVNCSAIPENLFESEMFGYEGGTFTGANRSGRQGKFEIASGGTIFLDEIGELPLEMQAKLLRILQERRFYRVGGTNPIEVDVRVIAATNRKLSEQVQEGKFREDLFYRLNVVNLEIPPLRQRKDDIPGLVERFIKELVCIYKRPVTGVTPEVMKVFQAYDWPGNVRQLRNLLESVIILMEDNFINLKSLSEAGVMETLQAEESSEPSTTADSLSTGETTKGLDNLMNRHERQVILKALKECHYNKAQAAQLLGIPRSTLYYKLKVLDIPQ